MEAALEGGPGPEERSYPLSVPLPLEAEIVAILSAPLTSMLPGSELGNCLGFTALASARASCAETGNSCFH
jgi:hypothetical protein